MPLINLTTRINAPIERCFNLARSIDLHLRTMESSREEAIAGVTSGLIQNGETVTWRARHFGIWFRMKIGITAMAYPTSFTDEQMSGPFKILRHDHSFQSVGGDTIMTCAFHFQSPAGIIGKIVDSLFLQSYMKRLLEHRNRIIKQTAESHQ